MPRSPLFPHLALLGDPSGMKSLSLLGFQKNDLGWEHMTPLSNSTSVLWVSGGGDLSQQNPGHSLPVQFCPQEPDQVYEGITFEDFLKVGAGGKTGGPGDGGSRTS